MSGLDNGQDPWGQSPIIRDLAAAEDAAFAAMGRFLKRHAIWIVPAGIIAMTWAFWSMMIGWAIVVAISFAVMMTARQWHAGRQAVVDFFMDITAAPRRTLQAWRSRLDAKAARLEVGPHAPVFDGQPRNEDDRTAREEMLFIGRLSEPTAEQRLTFSNVWGLMIEQGENPVQRVFALAENQGPSPIAHTSAVPFMGAAAVVTGSVWRYAALGLGATTLLAGAAWGYGELIERPSLERKAATADRLQISLDEAVAANDAFAIALAAERRERERERAAAVDYQIQAERELVQVRQRMEQERVGRLNAQREARRAIDEASGLRARRNDGDWLRDITTGGPATAGGLSSLPPGAPARSDP